MVEEPVFVNETEPLGFWPAGAERSTRATVGRGLTLPEGAVATSSRTGTVMPPCCTPLPDSVIVPSYVPAGCAFDVIVID